MGVRRQWAFGHRMASLTFKALAARLLVEVLFAAVVGNVAGTVLDLAQWRDSKLLNFSTGAVVQVVLVRGEFDLAFGIQPSVVTRGWDSC